jgi:hypothetical protein
VLVEHLARIGLLAMNKFLAIAFSTLFALTVADVGQGKAPMGLTVADWGKGKAPIGKGKGKAPPPPVVTKG